MFSQTAPIVAGGPWDRRQYLRLALAAGAGCLWGQPMTADALADQKPTSFIDAHVHVWTPDTEQYPLAAGFRRDQMEPASFTPEQLLAHARPAGVGRIVLIQMSFYGFDNRYMLDCVRRQPDVFSAVAVIDDADPKQAVAAMEQLAGQGVRGFRIYPRNLPPDRWLDGSGLKAMWAQAARSGQAMCGLVNPRDLPAIDRACERFPDTPVVIDHMARIGADGLIRPADVDALCKLARHRHVKVKVSAFYALGKKQPPYDDLVPLVRRLCDAFGPQRLMWASDCPFQVVDQTYRDSIDFIHRQLGFLTADERSWLLEKTAAQTYFFPVARS